jgi:hypothetical protein
MRNKRKETPPRNFLEVLGLCSTRPRGRRAAKDWLGQLASMSPISRRVDPGDRSPFRVRTFSALVEHKIAEHTVAECSNRRRVSVKVSFSQVARFPEGTLARSGAHDVCQSGELSSRHSSNLRRYPWSLASQVFDHPYRANRTDGLAYRCRPAQMDCRGLRLSQVDKNVAWTLHPWQP